MNIRRRANGGWCMEHNGVEAPYDVVCHVEGKFSVFDMDDEFGEESVVALEDTETCRTSAAKVSLSSPMPGISVAIKIPT